MVRLLEKVIKFCIWWSNKEFVGFVGIFFILALFARLISIIPSFISSILFPVEESVSRAEEIISNDGVVLSFFMLCIIVPILETLIFQHVAIYFIKKRTKKTYLQILFSAILFGVFHPYSFSYIIFATLMGGVFATGFFFYKRTKGTKMAILATSVTHGLSNLISMASVLTS